MNIGTWKSMDIGGFVQCFSEEVLLNSTSATSELTV